MKKTIITVLLALGIMSSNACDRPIRSYICSKKAEISELLTNNVIADATRAIVSNPYVKEIKELSIETASRAKSSVITAALWSRQHKIKSALIAFALYELYRFLSTFAQQTRDNKLSTETLKTSLNATITSKLLISLRILSYFGSMREVQTLIRNYIFRRN